MTGATPAIRYLYNPFIKTVLPQVSTARLPFITKISGLIRKIEVPEAPLAF